MWEIAPHYLKIKKSRMPFLETVEKNFLGFNDPSKHKHAVKNLCSKSELFLLIVPSWKIFGLIGLLR